MGVLAAVTGMLILAIAIGIGRFAFTPLLPVMQQDYHLPLQAAAGLAAANYIGYFLGALSAVWLRFAAPLMIFIALMIIALSTLGMGFTESLTIWLVLRFLAGVTSAWALIFASAWILPILTQLDQPRLGGVMFAGVGLGTSLAGLACLLFLALSWSSAQGWIALSLLAFSLIVIIALITRLNRPKPVCQTASSTVRAKPSSLRLKPYLLPVICYGLFGFAYIIPATFLPTMAKALLPDPLLFGWAWPVFGLAALVSTLAAGSLSARLRNRTIWAYSHIIMSLGVALPLVWPGLTGILLSALGVGGTFMVATLTGMQEARRIAPQQAQALMAAMTAAFGLGQIMGPLLVGAFGHGESNFTAPLLIAAIAAGGSGAALLLTDKTDTKH